MFRVVRPPIIRTAYDCICSIWYLSVAVTVLQIPDAADTVVCGPNDGWKYHPKDVEQFPDINEMCNVATCWIYIRILLGAYPILHISRLRVKYAGPSGSTVYGVGLRPLAC
jgi:hypothetical protein